MDVLDKIKTSDLVELLARRKPICRRRVFKKKFNAKGKVEKYNSHLVENVYYKVEGIYFTDFSFLN